jgi:hypothetical protein
MIVLAAMSAACAQVQPTEADAQEAPAEVTKTENKATTEPEAPVKGEGSCDAGKARSLIGREKSEPLGAEALRLSGARTIRWIRPGDVVTMDYREDRLNIHLDGQNKVVRIACG